MLGREEFPWDLGAVRPRARLIAFVLRITDIDPLRYGLIFERFLIRSGSARLISTWTFAWSDAAK